MTKYKKVSVLGLGYVGLPTAAIIANKGLRVIGVDTNASTVKTINEGKTHIIEPDLEVLVRSAVNSKNLVASTIPEPADAFIIAVPTPFTTEKKPDLTFLQQAIESIAPVIKGENLIILESTSPVGTTQKVAEWLSNVRQDIEFSELNNIATIDSKNIYIAHSPERVLPGRVLLELVNNDRVIGGLTEQCGSEAESLYRLFVKGNCHVTNARTAELVKLTENAYRDTNIAFANEISLVCDKLDIDVWELIKLANRHPRVDILKPGPGVGGHCIAVDPWFIVDSAPDETPLIRASRFVNDNKPTWIVQKILNTIDENATLACLGLTYKSDIDDLRESPSMAVIEELAKCHKGQILLADPNIESLPDSLRKILNIKFCDFEEAISRSEVIILLTDHREFIEINKSILSNKTVFDTRGIWRSFLTRNNLESVVD
ncbi:MAG: UDP-N-acetyl-D-mannosamine dehydrogenase [Rhodospirillaceae bacterium]|nr:UDP-N-acetyl-D-mannosamine dehydrogenase [Rhodospirillaceae bacterium]OUT80666.1 MAG: UDP-N-acetyl-D-mannosamine dehydrogenase [Rhodospirillaceae bacterium TMED23]